MASWMDKPPSKEELAKSNSWMDAPPTKEELEGPKQANGYIEGALKSLPFAGGLFGGAAGLVAGPVGGVAGAGAGGYTGKATENMIRGYLGSPYSDSLPRAETSIGRMAGVTGQNLAAAPEQAINEMGGQALSAGISKFGPKIAAKLSNVPEQDIKTYLKNPEKIEGMIKQSGEKNDISSQVDEARQSANKTITSYKSGINKDIGNSLANSPTERTIDITPVQNAIGEHISRVSKLSPESKAELMSLQKRLSDFTQGTNKVNPQELNELRTYLQDLSEGQFPKPQGPGQYFSKNDPGARAAKDAWKATRTILQEASPQIGDSLSKLSELRKLTKSAQPGLLKEGGNTASYVAAGRGTAPHNTGLLNKLSELTQTPIDQTAQQLSAAQSLGRTDVNPLQFFSAGVLQNPQSLRMAIKANEATGGSLMEAGKYGGRIALDKAQGLIPGGGVAGAISNLQSSNIEHLKERLAEIRSNPKDPMYRSIQGLSDEQALPAINMLESAVTGGMGVGSINSMNPASKAFQLLEEIGGSYGKPWKALDSQKAINDAVVTLKQLGEEIKSQPRNKELTNLYDSLKYEVEKQIEKNPQSNYAKTKDVKERRSLRGTFPSYYQLHDDLAEVKSLPQNPSKGFLTSPGEVIPFKNQSQMKIDKTKTRARPILQRQLDTYGMPVDAQTVNDAYSGRDRIWDDINPEADAVSYKYANQKNTEKARGGEFQAGSYYMNPNVYPEAAKINTQVRARSLKQLKQNHEQLLQMAQQIEQQGQNSPKDLVDMYREMGKQNMAAARELKAKNYRSLPSPESLVGGEVIPAQDTFQMWGGRPNVRGKKGNVVSVENVGPYRNSELRRPEDQFEDKYVNPDTGEDTFQQKPGLLIPSSEFIDRRMSLSPSKENEEIQDLLNQLSITKSKKEANRLGDLIKKKMEEFSTNAPVVNLR